MVESKKSSETFIFFCAHVVWRTDKHYALDGGGVGREKVVDCVTFELVFSRDFEW